MLFTHRYTTPTTYQVVEYYQGGSRILPHDQHDYLKWCETNTPAIEASGRFLSVVDGVLVVDPNMETILAAEKKAADNNIVYAKLVEIDQKSIRGIREWIVLQPTAEKFTKDLETEATAERAKIQP